MKRKPERVAVIGAGPSGLFAAQILAREGLQVALFESHSKPGGCASYFGKKSEAGRVSFDAGATVLDGFRPGDVLDRLVRSFGVELGPVEPVKAVRFRLGPNENTHELSTASPEEFLDGLKRLFPSDPRAHEKLFPSLLALAKALNDSFKAVPHLPWRNFEDLRLTAPALRALALHPLAIAKASTTTFADELAQAGASDRLKRWVDMNLLITLQAPASRVSSLYAAMALFFYPLGAASLAGGMRALFDPLLQNLMKRSNAEVYMRSPVLMVDTCDEGYLIRTVGEKTHGPFDSVISSVPRYNASQIFASSPFGAQDSWNELSPELWSAFTGYFVVNDDPAFPETSFHVHSTRVESFDEAVDGGDVYLSFSSRASVDRSPPGHRSLTISTHVRPDPARWHAHDGYRDDKIEFGRRALRSHFESLFPQAKIVFEDYGSPKTFVRYTRREAGTVGGIPLTQAHSLFRAPSQRTRLPHVYQIGDTSFPGQSVYACAIGACAVAEKILGRKVNFDF